MTINLTNRTIEHAEITEQPHEAQPEEAQPTTKKLKEQDHDEVLDQMLHLLEKEPREESDEMKTD